MFVLLLAGACDLRADASNHSFRKSQKLRFIEQFSDEKLQTRFQELGEDLEEFESTPQRAWDNLILHGIEIEFPGEDLDYSKKHLRESLGCDAICAETDATPSRENLLCRFYDYFVPYIPGNPAKVKADTRELRALTEGSWFSMPYRQRIEFQERNNIPWLQFRLANKTDFPESKNFAAEPIADEPSGNRYQGPRRNIELRTRSPLQTLADVRRARVAFRGRFGSFANFHHHLTFKVNHAWTEQEVGAFAALVMDANEFAGFAALAAGAPIEMPGVRAYLPPGLRPMSLAVALRMKQYLSESFASQPLRFNDLVEDGYKVLKGYSVGVRAGIYFDTKGQEAPERLGLELRALHTSNHENMAFWLLATLVKLLATPEIFAGATFPGLYRTPLSRQTLLERTPDETSLRVGRPIYLQAIVLMQYIHELPIDGDLGGLLSIPLVEFPRRPELQDQTQRLEDARVFYSAKLDIFFLDMQSRASSTPDFMWIYEDAAELLEEWALSAQIPLYL